MTLPASGAITAAMINVELGRASGDPFSIGGSEERALAGVPSGVISFSDFYGKSAANPPIWTAASGADKYGSGSQTASIYMYAAGNITINNGTNGFWLPDGASASDYRVKWVYNSGSTITSNMSQNTWYTLTSTYYLSLTSGIGWKTSNATITIEQISTGEQKVQPVLLSAENSNGGGILL